MILTGETNLFPQDGAAIDEINRLDREYTALFAGKSMDGNEAFPRVVYTCALNGRGEENNFQVLGGRGCFTCG